MPQNVIVSTVGREWDFLEPAQNPSYARTDHVVLLSPAASSGLYISYPAGQLLRQKDDGTNVFAKEGQAGHTGPARLLKYPHVVNDTGAWQYGDTWLSGGDTHEGSVSAYHQGDFKTQDITGFASLAALRAVGALIRGTYLSGIFRLGVGASTPPA